MFKNPLLIAALAITGAIAIWGLVDTAGLANLSSTIVGVTFTSRGWFIMLTASFHLIIAIWLAFSPYGRIKLGHDDDQPEFSTVSWLTMLFAAGMGVGLLFFGAAEPITHFLVLRDYETPQNAAMAARFITNFHWGLHAWAIYGPDRPGDRLLQLPQRLPTLISAPIKKVFGVNPVTRASSAG